MNQEHARHHHSQNHLLPPLNEIYHAATSSARWDCLFRQRERRYARSANRPCQVLEELAVCRLIRVSHLSPGKLVEPTGLSLDFDTTVRKVLRQITPPYSALNASIGSRPAARSAGGIAARIVTISRVPATTASVNGSCAETPCSIATTNCVVKNSAIVPKS